MMRAILAALLLMLSLQTGFAATAPDALSDPAQEARARALQKELRCLVCQGELLDESNAPARRRSAPPDPRAHRARRKRRGDQAISRRALRRFHPDEAAVRGRHLASLARTVRCASPGRRDRVCDCETGVEATPLSSPAEQHDSAAGPGS